MLYLGKSGGRNCYTIYEKDKHEDIKVSAIVRRGVFADIHEIKSLIEKTTTEGEKVFSVMPLLVRVDNGYTDRVRGWIQKGGRT